MPERSRAVVMILCWLASAALTLGAALQFAGSMVHEGPWLMLCGAAALVAGALRIQSLTTTSQHLAKRNASEVGLLRAELEEQRKAVDSLADGLDVAIFICDEKANVLYANRRATVLFRFDHPVGRTVLAVTLSNPLEQLVLQAQASRSALHAEISFTFPDERVGLAKAWVPDSDARRVFLSVYEISDLRRLERVRQDFVANVSHELRTPMTLIRAMAETLLDDDPPDQETSQRYLNKMISEVDRLSMITQDLLVLSAAESNPVRKHGCDLAEVLRSVVQQLEFKGNEKGLRLEYLGPEHLTIEANTAQMTQVALNLIDNAINYTIEGHVKVSLREDGQRATFTIQDSGIGIAGEQMSRIFERFYRVDKGRSRSTGGTGLGLSIVKHIVEAHGGTVRVQSALRRGSTFEVSLPIGSPVLADATSTE